MIPSGKRLHYELENHHVFMGKLTNFPWPCSIAIYVKFPEGSTFSFIEQLADLSEIAASPNFMFDHHSDPKLQFRNLRNISVPHVWEENNIYGALTCISHSIPSIFASNDCLVPQVLLV